MNIIALILLSIMAFTGIAFIMIAPQPEPNTCPKCKEKYQQLEEWSFTEYCWGLRCPHCKYEFDTMP